MKLSITIMSGQGTIHSYRTLYAILICVTVISTFCVTNVTSQSTTTTPQTNGTPSNTSTTSQPSNGNETSTVSPLCLNLTCIHGNCSVINQTASCSCDAGWQGDTCQTECLNNTFGQNCTNTCNCSAQNTKSCHPVNGTCFCLPGWNGSSCAVDIDECSQNIHNCTGNQNCMNKNGSFECVCKPGYFHNGTNICVECGPNLYGFNCSSSCNCTSNHTFCHPVNGTCLCRPGWNGTSCEVDVDECSMRTNNCTAKNEECRNTNGSFECVCHDGYHRNGSGVCVDCTNNTFGYNCSSICMCTIGNTENCNHVNGTCVCLPGWNGSLCELDIDECKTHNCTKNEHCENRNGSFHCVCDRGYIRNSNNTCVECSNNTFGDNCTNTCNCFTQNTDSCNPVNGTCNCLHGWNGSSCEEDINECSQQKNICTDNAQCLNKNGSFECVCSTGYTRNSSNICAACTNNTYGENCTKPCNCTSGGNTKLCNHVNGTCVCSPGWNGTLCEKDINECEVNKHNCTVFEVCINTNGSFKCECAPGSQRNASGFCNDINECSEKPCKNAIDCINSIGSYRCICQKGWIGINCSEDINECEKSDTCPDPNSVCTNENGTFSCPCKSGFERVLTDRNCTAEILLKNFNTSNSQAVTGDDNIFGPYNIPGGVSVNGKLLRVLYVSINGYMTFDTKVSQSSMPQMGSPFLSDLVVIAPYWTDIHILPESSGKLYLRELSLLDASKVNETQTVYSDIKEILANQNVSQFCPIYAFVATWMNVLPFNASKFQNMQSATFQVIFITDGKQSFVIVNYRTIWPSTENLNVGAMFLIPSTAQNETWNPLASFPTRKVFSHSDLNVPTTSCSNAECINWQHVKRNIKGPVGTPCPCSLPQARADKLFKATPPDVEMACVEGKTYDSAGVKQVCCYDISTKMLYTDPSSFTKTALFKDPNVNQDVQKGHNLCCNNSSDRCFEFFTLFPPDTCKSYKAPKTALLWGDPHLLTLDGNEYSFNGWGDYVLLKTPDSTLQIQGRTKKLFGFNVTVFTAFAIKNANDPVIEIHLANNRTVVYLNGIQKNLTNGSFSTDTTFLEFENATTETSLLIVFYSEIAMQINAGSDRLSLSFDLRGNRLYNSTGLLGLVDENATNDFLFRNASSLTAADLKPEEIFQFGQSWLVTNTSESLFNSTNGDVYNPDPSFVPTFLPSTVAEIVTKLNSSGKLAVAQELCFGNLACLQDYYITGSNASATETKTIQENTQLLQKFLAKRPPEFVGMPEVWNVSVSKGAYRLIISLKADSNTSRISISRASSLNYTFNSNTSEFVWFLSPNLRNISDIAISFTATNADNMSSLYQPKISLCACEQESQCDFSLTASNFTGNYYSSECHCGQNRAGKFCELQVNVCTMCFPNASCNTSATIDNPCQGCPFGYTGDGIKCYEENECLRTENKPCQHICINTIGSYYCSCNPGYASLGNGQCGDIDECSKDNNCSKTQICKNTEGSYMCQCRPGYAGVACQKEVKSVFGGQLVFSAKANDISSSSSLTTGSPTFKLLAEKVKNEIFSTLNKSIPYLIDVEVIQLEWLGNKRRRRSAEPPTINSTFQVYLNGIVNITSLNYALAAGFNSDCADDYCTFGSMIGVMKTQSKFPVNYDLCTFDRNNDCHLASTICTSYGNGTVGCSCREGYQPWSGYSNVCEDINECTKNTTLCTNKENNETGCVNLPGSYSCTCQTGRWNATSMKCILYDKCGTASPCQNGECTNTGEGPGYVCKCAYGWTGLNCDAKDGEAERMKDTVIGLAAGLGSFCFILLIIIIVLCVLRTRSKGKKQNEYNGHYSIPRPGLISSEQVEMSRGESMHKYTEFRSRTLLDVDDEPPNHNGKARQKEYQNPTFQADEDHYLRL